MAGGVLNKRRGGKERMRKSILSALMADSPLKKRREKETVEEESDREEEGEEIK